MKSRVTTAASTYFWRASLDTVSFMPVNSADVFGGVILTTPSAEAPNERFKINVYILGRELRADGLPLLCSVRSLHATVNGQTRLCQRKRKRKLKIPLTRARQLRNAAILRRNSRHLA